MVETRRVMSIREIGTTTKRHLDIREEVRCWEIKGIRINAPVPEWPYPSVEDTHAYYIMPMWTLQAKSIEYRLDIDHEWELLLDMVMHEPYIPDYDDPELWFALSRWDARELHLKRVMEVKSTTVRWDFDSVLGRQVKRVLWEHRKGYDDKLQYLDAYVDQIRSRAGGGDSERPAGTRDTPVASGLVVGQQGLGDPRAARASGPATGGEREVG